MYPPETHISGEGRRQLEEFAQRLKNMGIIFDAIETSPFTRAVESANTVAKVLGTKLITENPAFSDSHVPGWFGVPLDEQQQLMDKGEDIYLNPRSDDQEKYNNIAERMFVGYKDLLNRHKGESVAIVSHGDPIRLLLYRLQYPTGEIPNMSILSKYDYLKRGEIYHTLHNEGGNLLESGFILNREGMSGERELYNDTLLHRRK